MKILLVANVAKEHVIKFHLPFIKRYVDEGNIVDVACSGSEKIDYCTNQYTLSYKRTPFSLKTIKGIVELNKIINKNNYDLVYCHTPIGGLAARLASMKQRRTRQLKVIYYAHGYHFYKNAPILNWIIYYPIEKFLSFLTDAIILSNNEDYILTKNKFKNVKAFKCHSVGVNLNKFIIQKNKEELKFKYRSDMAINESTKVIIYVAELTKNKNQQLLINAVNQLLKEGNKCVLVLVGPDHYNGHLQKNVRKMGLTDKVKFLGWRNDIAELLNMADIYAASSIREGLGINLIEAMSSNLPVVASYNKGHAMVVENEVNGIILKNNTSFEMKNSIFELFSNSELCQKLVFNSQETIKKYDIESVLNEIREIFNEVMGEY